MGLAFVLIPQFVFPTVYTHTVKAMNLLLADHGDSK